MIFMEINLKDLVPIINACRKNGVSTIKIGEVEIDFTEKKVETPSYSSSEIIDDLAIETKETKPPRWDMEELALTDPSAWAQADMGDEL